MLALTNQNNNREAKKHVHRKRQKTLIPSGAELLFQVPSQELCLFLYTCSFLNLSEHFKFESGVCWLFPVSVILNLSNHLPLKQRCVKELGRLEVYLGIDAHVTVQFFQR